MLAQLVRYMVRQGLVHADMIRRFLDIPYRVIHIIQQVATTWIVFFRLNRTFHLTIHNILVVAGIIFYVYCSINKEQKEQVFALENYITDKNFVCLCNGNDITDSI